MTTLRLDEAGTPIPPFPEDEPDVLVTVLEPDDEEWTDAVVAAHREGGLTASAPIVPGPLADDLVAVLQAGIDRVRKLVVARIRERAIVAAPFQLGDVNVFTPAEWADAFGTDAVDVIGDVVVDAATGQAVMIGTNIGDDAVAATVTDHVGRLRDIGDQVRASVADSLRLSIEQGLSLPDTVRELTATGPLSVDAAQRWARTELAAAANGGMHSAWRAGGIPFKRWRTVRDDRVRDAHEDAEGQTVPVTQDFTLTDETGDHPATYPGDPRLPVGLRINCRCFMERLDADGTVRRDHLDQATKAQLRTLADQLGIPGRASMSRGELQRTIGQWMNGLGDVRLDQLTRVQMLARARTLGIKGRHAMSKAELFEALVDPRGKTWMVDTGYMSKGDLAAARRKVAGRRISQGPSRVTAADSADLLAEAFGTYGDRWTMPCVSCGAKLHYTSDPVLNAARAEVASLSLIDAAKGWSASNVVPLCRACAYGVASLGLDVGSLLDSAADVLVAAGPKGAQMANPWHDQQGRFAPKGTGKRVDQIMSKPGDQIELTDLGIEPATPEQAAVAEATRDDEDLWAGAEPRQVSWRDKFVGTEGSVDKRPVREVVVEGEPFRKGYPPRLYELGPNSYLIADGHHRLVMHSLLESDAFDAVVLPYPTDQETEMSTMEFANPWHDEAGRFAEKGYRRVRRIDDATVAVRARDGFEITLSDPGDLIGDDVEEETLNGVADAYDRAPLSFGIRKLPLDPPHVTVVPADDIPVVGASHMVTYDEDGQPSMLLNGNADFDAENTWMTPPTVAMPIGEDMSYARYRAMTAYADVHYTTLKWGQRRQLKRAFGDLDDSDPVSVAARQNSRAMYSELFTEYVGSRGRTDNPIAQSIAVEMDWERRVRDAGPAAAAVSRVSLQWVTGGPVRDITDPVRAVAFMPDGTYRYFDEAGSDVDPDAAIGDEAPEESDDQLEESFAVLRGGLRFANPWHDEQGKFAPKGTGTKAGGPGDLPGRAPQPHETEEANAAADEVFAGRPVDVEPDVLDDLVYRFADSTDPVDLTLVTVVDNPGMFSEMRGSGIPRSEMPQIAPELLNSFQDRLREQGIVFGRDDADPRFLKATQSELDGRNVGGIAKKIAAGQFDLESNPLWVSADGHVLDGHHRWAAAAAVSAGCDGCIDLPVVKVDLPIHELLAIANQFNDDMGVQRKSFGQPDTRKKAAAVTDEPVYYGMATDTADGVDDADLADLPHGDGTLTGAAEPTPTTEPPGDDEMSVWRDEAGRSVPKGIIYFANPWHDVQGRFAPKGTGRTSGFEGPAEQKIQATPESEALAAEIAARAAAAEPELTARIAELTGDPEPAVYPEDAPPPPQLWGYDFRLKKESTIAEKIERVMVEKGYTREQAAADIKDAVRYTVHFTDDQLAPMAQSTIDALRAENANVVVKNTWPKPEVPYKGINVNVWTHDGVVYELQFHTRRSQEVKEQMHKLYEQQRVLPPGSPRWNELEQEMLQMNAELDVPEGVAMVAAAGDMAGTGWWVYRSHPEQDISLVGRWEWPNSTLVEVNDGSGWRAAPLLLELTEDPGWEEADQATVDEWLARTAGA